jgi:hypothetical protein
MLRRLAAWFRTRFPTAALGAGSMQAAGPTQQPNAAAVSAGLGQIEAETAEEQTPEER